MSNKSNNGKLIEEAIKQYVIQNIFKSSTGLKQSLQENLNSVLKFETVVTNIENKNNFIVGTVMFKNENEIDSIIDLTISYNNETIENYE